MAGFSVEVGGQPLAGVLQRSVRISRSLSTVSRASFAVRGFLASLVLPDFDAEVEILHGAEVLFAGRVQNPASKVTSREGFADVVVSCRGLEGGLGSTIIQQSDGILIAEESSAEDQFDRAVGLLTGLTGTTDVGAGTPVATDVRYLTVDRFLRELASLNDALLTVSPAGVVSLTSRANLPDSGAPRLGPAHIRGADLRAQPRSVVSRQFVRFGDSSLTRNLVGDGAEREFLVAGDQAAVDYMADGVAARPLNSDSGDQGLRFRDDADAEARTGGGIDFFGGNADDAGSGFYVGAMLAAASSVSLRMLTDGKMQLRAGGIDDSVRGYGIAIRHDGSGNPVWTSSGITPTVEPEDGDMVRDADRDFSLLVNHSIEGGYAIHGETVILEYNNSLYGFRLSGGAVVRDTRFDEDVSTRSGRSIFSLFFVGDILYLCEGRNSSTLSGTISLYAYRITSGSLSRLSSEDVTGVAAVSGSTLDGSRAIAREAFHRGGKVYLSATRGGGGFAAYDAPSGGVLARSSADDFDIGAVSGWPASVDTLSRDGSAWVSGDWFYQLRASHATITQRYLTRVNLTNLERDTVTVSIPGTDPIKLLAFGGYMYVGARNSENTPGTIPPGAAGRPTDFKAVRIEQNYLEWDAPSADYTTLNTRRQANDGFRVAVMDPDLVGVSVADAEFTPIPVDVVSVSAVVINDVRHSLGDEEEWTFSRARQKIIQAASATVVGATDVLVVHYRARGIAQACNPSAAIIRDRLRTLPGSGGVDLDEASDIATKAVERFGDLPQFLNVRLKPMAEADLLAFFDTATTVQFDSAFLRTLGVENVLDADKWVIVGLGLTTPDDLFRYSLGVLRGEFIERAVDWWRDVTRGAGE